MLCKAHINMIVYAGVVLLYLGAALLTVRLASEATTVYYERHLIWGAKFDRWPAAMSFLHYSKSLDAVPRCRLTCRSLLSCVCLLTLYRLAIKA